MHPLDVAVHRLGWSAQASSPNAATQVGLPAPIAALVNRQQRRTNRGTCYLVGAQVIAAGLAVPHPRLDEGVSELSPRLPAFLTAFYRVHNGMGPAGVPSAPFANPRLFPVGQVAPLTHWMRFGENDILYAPGDWLRFTADTLGGWCVSEPGEMRHWNAHTHALGPRDSADAPWRALAMAWTQA